MRMLARVGGWGQMERRGLGGQQVGRQAGRQSVRP